MAKDVLLLFSYGVYPSGLTRFEQHANILNKAQGDSPRVNFSRGVLADLIFMFDGTKMTITEPVSGRDLTSYALVFFQKWMMVPQFALATALYLEHEQIDFMSHEVLHQNPIMKLPEMFLLVYAGLPYPKTVVASLASLITCSKEGKLPFSFPFIIKDIDGTQGQDNYLVKDQAQLTEIMRASPHIVFMAQEFISNDCDYRITIMGGEVKYVLRRTRQEGTHLNNTSQGAIGEFLSLDFLPLEVMRDAKKAAEATNRIEFAGVDVLIDPSGKHWILEVNRSPEIQTGFNSELKSKLFIEYITKRIEA